jgi:hypothetical protein
MRSLPLSIRILELAHTSAEDHRGQWPPYHTVRSRVFQDICLMNAWFSQPL